MPVIDRAKEAREGEALDPGRLEAFLCEAMPELQGPLEIKQFPSGFSNLTYRLRFANRDLVLRRPPIGTKAQTAHDMQREYKILHALRPHYDLCPAPLLYTADDTIIGSPFFVMERIRGIILRKNLPEGLALPPRDCRTLCGRFVEAVFSRLHRSRLPSAAGLDDTSASPQGYVARQVTRLVAAATATPAPPDAPRISRPSWTGSPPACRRTRPHPAIVHNDFRFDNLVLAPDRTPCASSASWTGSWPPSAIPSWTWATVWPTGSRPTTRRSGNCCGSCRPTWPACSPGVTSWPAYAAGAPGADTDKLRLLRLFRPLPPGRHRPADLLPLLSRPDPGRALQDADLRRTRARKSRTTRHGRMAFVKYLSHR
jgi:aminoglycoside phosphotransferase (APT) family kinase protein